MFKSDSKVFVKKEIADGHLISSLTQVGTQNDDIKQAKAEETFLKINRQFSAASQKDFFGAAQSKEQLASIPDQKNYSDLEISKANELYYDAKTSFQFNRYEEAYRTFLSAKETYKNIRNQTKVPMPSIKKKIEKINDYLNQCLKNSKFDNAKLQYNDAKSEFKFENHQEAYKKFLAARTLFKEAKKFSEDDTKISAKLKKIDAYLDQHTSVGNNMAPK